MAYDPTKPDNDTYLNELAELLREQFRAIIEDDLVSAADSAELGGVSASFFPQVIGSDAAFNITASNWRRIARLTLGETTALPILKLAITNNSGIQENYVLAVSKESAIAGTHPANSGSIKLLAVNRGASNYITKARLVARDGFKYAYLEIYSTATVYGYLYCASGGGIFGSPVIPTDEAGTIPADWSAVESDLTVNLTHGRDTITSDGTWVCPAGVWKIWVTAIGGGGGGGGAGRTNSTTYFHGAGGKAGTFVLNQAVAVEPGRTYDIDIGAGGAGGATGDSDPDPGAAGTNGADTVLSYSSTPILTCAGGAGGAAGSDTVSQGETMEILGQSSPFGPCLRGSDYGSEAGYGNGGFGGHRHVSPGPTVVVYEGQTGRNGLLIIEY